MKNCKAIIFDLGGVLLNIDYKLTIDAFEKLGIKNAISFYSKKGQNSIFDKIEVGEISLKIFLELLQKQTHNANLKAVEDAWNAMLLDLPQKRLEYIKKLKNTYKIFLLSNTNEIHINAFKRNLGNTKWGEFKSLFDKMYLSHEIGYRKPNKEVFQIILKENGLQKMEVVFIDDSLQHIKAAENLGIKCHYLQETEDITEIFLDITQ